jgi:quinoprotein glucose dehydrogenase
VGDLANRSDGVPYLIQEIALRRRIHPADFDRPMVYTPGFGGGVEWGGASVDVDRGIMTCND